MGGRQLIGAQTRNRIGSGYPSTAAIPITRFHPIIPIDGIGNGRNFDFDTFAIDQSAPVAPGDDHWLDDANVTIKRAFVATGSRDRPDDALVNLKGARTAYKNHLRFDNAFGTNKCSFFACAGTYARLDNTLVILKGASTHCQVALGFDHALVAIEGSRFAPPVITLGLTTHLSPSRVPVWHTSVTAGVTMHWPSTSVPVWHTVMATGVTMHFPSINVPFSHALVTTSGVMTHLPSTRVPAHETKVPDPSSVPAVLFESLQPASMIQHAKAPNSIRNEAMIPPNMNKKCFFLKIVRMQ